jgi:hypothetical protein
MRDFGAKRIFLRATSDFAELPWYGEKACREYRLVALRQICLSNALATLPARKRRAAEFSP